MPIRAFLRRQLSSQQLRCRHFFSTVSCTGQYSPQFGHANWGPASKSSQSLSWRPATSISLLTTFHPLPSPRAIPKSTFASIAVNFCTSHAKCASTSCAVRRTAPSRSPPNACRGERCGAWGRTAPIKSVRFFHSKRRSASFLRHAARVVERVVGNRGIRSVLNALQRSPAVEEMLQAIARDPNPHRPGRCEPRVRKRRPQNYRLMTKPRHEMGPLPHRKVGVETRPKVGLS